MYTYSCNYVICYMPITNFLVSKLMMQHNLALHVFTLSHWQCKFMKGNIALHHED